MTAPVTASPDVETIILGAGVVGLAVARRLAVAGHEVVVIERHDRTGAETSSRNSEVIHAGLYYPAGSLRARCCVAGRDRLYRFAEDNGVATNRCGKLVVATEDAEIPALEAIAAKAVANGVEVRLLTRAQARALEPALACVAALHSPSTGVIDTHGLLTALEGHVTTTGGEIVLATEVGGIALRKAGGFRLTTRPAVGGAESDITCRNLVVAAGLGAPRIAEMLAGAWTSSYRPPRLFPAKGHYFTLMARAPFHRLIYPVPSGAWLGIHLTLDIAGQAKFGPDLEWVDRIDYGFDDPGGARRDRFANEIRRYWPGLPDDALAPGYTGIRPRIYAPGEPAADFAVHGPETHGIDGLVALFGIESPGLTAALALADVAADKLAAKHD